jgi:hypothetical protein
MREQMCVGVLRDPRVMRHRSAQLIDIGAQLDGAADARAALVVFPSCCHGDLSSLITCVVKATAVTAPYGTNR